MESISWSTTAQRNLSCLEEQSYSSEKLLTLKEFLTASRFRLLANNN